MVKGYILGIMGELMRVIGLWGKCMEREFSNGKMEESMKENIKMILKMDMEFLLGLK